MHSPAMLIAARTARSVRMSCPAIADAQVVKGSEGAGDPTIRVIVRRRVRAHTELFNTYDECSNAELLCSCVRPCRTAYNLKRRPSHAMRLVRQTPVALARTLLVRTQANLDTRPAGAGGREQAAGSARVTLTPFTVARSPSVEALSRPV